MTVVDTDRIDMADTGDERTPDMMFAWLEPAPEGFKVEIIAETIDLTATALGLTLPTDGFARG